MKIAKLSQYLKQSMVSYDAFSSCVSCGESETHRILNFTVPKLSTLKIFSWFAYLNGTKFCSILLSTTGMNMLFSLSFVIAIGQNKLAFQLQLYPALFLFMYIGIVWRHVSWAALLFILMLLTTEYCVVHFLFHSYVKCVISVMKSPVL